MVDLSSIERRDAERVRREVAPGTPLQYFVINENNTGYVERLGCKDEPQAREREREIVRQYVNAGWAPGTFRVWVSAQAIPTIAS